jgi:hypothetical protein
MSVDAEWSKDHISVIGPYTLILLEVYIGMVNFRPGGPVGESRGPSVGKDGKSDVESRHLQDCSPHLYRLRTDGLDPVSKYLTY